MKKIIFIILKAIGLLFIIILAIGAIWLLMQPNLPEDHQKVHDEYLLSEVFRPVADSSRIQLQRIMNDLDLPSLSVAVSVDDELAWACTFGFADIKNDIHPDQQTRYRSGSVSKSMTGLVCADLVEKGKIAVDASVYDYVPDFPNKRWSPTLRQLGAHTGGVRHYDGPGKGAFWKEQFSKHHYESLEEAMEIFKNDELRYEPGTDFTYSTHGFTLLGAAIEKASGRDFIFSMQDRLWNAHDMTYTTPDDYTKAITNRAVPYTRMVGKMVHMEGPDPSYKWAGGGILSTPSDLVKMGDAFMHGRIVDSAMVENIFTPSLLSDGSPNPQNYAMGWRNDRSSELLGTSDTLLVRHHGGSSPGGSSFLLMLPTEKVTAATMTNYSLRNSWPLREATFKIAGAFRNASVKSKTSIKESAPVINND